jgi:hypothetical protein
MVVLPRNNLLEEYDGRAAYPEDLATPVSTGRVAARNR